MELTIQLGGAHEGRLLQVQVTQRTDIGTLTFIFKLTRILEHLVGRVVTFCLALRVHQQGVRWCFEVVIRVCMPWRFNGLLQ